MSPPSGPQWMSNPPWAGAYARRRGGPANPELRVSDAERADVADKLSKHYGDGRLDQAEFNERMERAMSAKTRGDFAGLFSDLPDLNEEGAAAPAPAHPPTSRSPMYRLVLLILIVVAAAVLGQALLHSFFPWLLLAVVAFLWLRNNPRRHPHS